MTSTCGEHGELVTVPETRRLGRWVRRAGFAFAFLIAARVIAIGVDRGRALQRAAPEVFLGAAPLVGRDFNDGWDWRFGLGLVGAGIVGLVVTVAVWRQWFWRVRLRFVVLATAAAAMAFATALALTDGADGVLHGASDDTEYLSNLGIAPPADEFLRTFVDQLDRYSVHIRGHPPGFLLVLKFLDFIHLRGAWPVAMLSVLGAGIVVVATLIAVWAVAGGQWVRRAAPFLVVVPYALWLVTSADAVYAAVGASGVAAVAVALRLTSWRASAVGLAGGLLLGSLLFLTYLGVVFVLVPVGIVGVAATQRRLGALWAVAGAVAGGAVVIVAFRLAGFWWIDGARRTRTEYWEGTAQFRSWDYFRFGNIAVALIALGPAVFAGLLRLRDRRMWLLVGGGLAALAVSHVAQYTRGEVERIWLPLYPWLAIGAAALAPRAGRRSAAMWLGVQAVCAILLQAALVSKW
ncbi:hypothetical protein BH18ACT3_BH18ACT3_19780 [soil metagenome]